MAEADEIVKAGRARFAAAEVPVAERYLEFLSGTGHPFVRAPFAAPEADEPLSGGDRDALEEGRRALDAGDTVSDCELRDRAC